MVNPSEKQSDMEISVRGAIAERAFGLAEQLITNAVENGNGNPSFLYAALAEIRNAQQDFDSAQELTEKSLERDPHNPEARMQLAQAHLGKHEIEQAKALLADLADRCRMDARFHAIQARLYLHQHNFAKASEYAIARLSWHRQTVAVMH